MQYGQSYTVSYTNAGWEATPPTACLIRLGAVTHGFDQDQRRVPLNAASAEMLDPGVHALAIDTPANPNVAPPGYYMLFLLNEYARNQFAPCTMAAYVRVGP